MSERDQLVAERRPMFTAAVVATLAFILALFGTILVGSVLASFGYELPAPAAIGLWVWWAGYISAGLVIRWISRIP